MASNTLILLHTVSEQMVYFIPEINGYVPTFDEVSLIATYTKLGPVLAAVCHENCGMRVPTFWFPVQLRIFLTRIYMHT